jgi:hypothetical protein
MKVDRFINFFLALFGRDPDGSQKVRFHSQNLHGKERENVWLTRHGRWWLTIGRRTFRFEWATGFSCGLEVRIDHEDGLRFNVAFPPLSIHGAIPVFISTEGNKWQSWLEKYGGKGWHSEYQDFVLLSIRVFSATLWWQFLKFDWGWSSKMPKWMESNFHFWDFIVGDLKYSKEVLGTHSVSIPMPEGNYPATVTLEKCTWKRSRLPWNSRVGLFAKVDMSIGIPHPGKGENSWDCGEDRLFGASVEASTVEEAIAKTVQSALRSRRRYDGDVMVKYPVPVIQETHTPTHEDAAQFGG